MDITTKPILRRDQKIGPEIHVLAEDVLAKAIADETQRPGKRWRARRWRHLE